MLMITREANAEGEATANKQNPQKFARLGPKKI
jgi:hypothetical protein